MEAKKASSDLARARATLEAKQESPEMMMIRLSFTLKWWNRGMETIVPILLTKV